MLLSGKFVVFPFIFAQDCSLVLLLASAAINCLQRITSVGTSLLIIGAKAFKISFPINNTRVGL